MRQLRFWIFYGIVWLIISCTWIVVGQPAAAAAHGNFGETPRQPTKALKQRCTNAEKIDLNNANLIDFMDCPGFYPNLAQSIVKYGPYAQVEDVLKVSELSDQQKQRLRQNLDAFTVKDPTTPIEMRMPPRPSMRANP